MSILPTKKQTTMLTHIIITLCLMILNPVSSLLSIPSVNHLSSAPREQLTVYNASTQSGPFDDEFNNPTLNSYWHWYREDPTHWSLTASPGNLRIITQPNDIWRDNNSAPLLLQSMQPFSSYDIEIQTRIIITPTADHHQGGLVIYGDDDNYVRFTFAYIYGQKFEFAKEIGGDFQPIQVPAPPGTNDFHLRITKLGKNYSAYYSQDGSKWMLIGTHQNVNISPLEVGLLAFNAMDATKIEIPADFDYFRVTTGAGRTTVFAGQGFDKCEIPTLNQLQTWMTDSPYRVVNLYIGGSRRSCANTALTSSYVRTISQQGWKFIPTWVGPQCLYNDISSDLTTAYNQGVAEAIAAVNAAANLGLTLPDSSGTIIYYDMEGYTSQNPDCRDPAKSFIAGWTAQLHNTGNLSGVYGSSCAANISDFATISDIPDAIWPAGGGFSSTQYDQYATVWGNRCVPDTLWNNHQRIYQYTSGHQETWGGVSLNIDSNVIDGIVADVVVSSVRSTFKSQSGYDGRILESSETSNKGGSLNSGATTIFLGDNAQKKQYRSILSFPTKDLPDNAVITNVTLKVKKQSVAGGGDPVNSFKGFTVDIKTGFFGSAPGLQASDFQAKAIQSYGPFKPALKNGWYTFNLTSAEAAINKRTTNGGVTQIRLRFKLDDNNNAVANYLSLYSGNAPAASRPQLVIEYYVP